MLKNEEDLVKKIYMLVGKLKKLTLASKLYKLCGWRAQTSNATRWSSVFDILQCHENLQDHLRDLYSEDIDDSLLTAAEDRRFDPFFHQLKQLESVKKAVQSYSTTVKDARFV